MDLEAVADNDHSTDNEEQESDSASSLFIIILMIQLHLIDDFIDDGAPTASGSGTRQYMSWNSLQNDEALNDFFAGIYERSRTSRMRHTVEVIDPHDCIRSLPGAEEFPLWRIGCRVRVSFIKSKKND